MLNSDQLKALHTIKTWWKGNDLFMVLDGAGGTGKSYLVDFVLQSINCKPLILAPTNEALKQLRDKVQGDYEFRTVHNALGIVPDKTEKDLKFSQIKLPSFWESFNLCIVDEVSMLDEWLLDILLEIGIKILFIGHSSQLPPVVVNRKISDECVSPVFSKGFKVATLKEPMRNTGDLWDFNNYLEAMIHTKERIVPKTFDINKVELTKLLNTSKEDFLNDRTKVVLWTNDGVDVYNKKIRYLIHGDEAKDNPYLPEDRIILTSPLSLVHRLEGKVEKNLLDSMNKTDTIYSNSKATVISCEKVIVYLNKVLTIPCYKLNVRFDHYFNPIHVYTCRNEADLQLISTYYEHEAWGYKGLKARTDAFERRRFIISCFAQLKHFFASTSHRLQGSSVPNIVVIDSDISKNPNLIEQKKTRYVACSRAIDNLYFFRGIM